MHRRPSTNWLPKEIRAFRLLGTIEESDLALMERYYQMNWPPRHNKNALRTDLYTLLNNWTPELDRANTWHETHSPKPIPKKIIQMPPVKSEPFVPSEDEAEAMERFQAERKLRRPSAFQDVKKIMEGA